MRAAGGRFDVVSAALLVIQMAFPQYRGKNGMAKFQRELAIARWDLKAWRAEIELRSASSFSKDMGEGFDILDQFGGFELLAGCLRREPGQRMSSAAAARSPFCLL